MPVAAIIHDKAGYAVLELRGETTPVEVSDVRRILEQTPGYSTLSGLVIDVRHNETPLDAGYIIGAVRESTLGNFRRSGTRVAVVVATTNHLINARIMKTEGEQHGMNVRIFDAREEAEFWVMQAQIETTDD